MRGSVAPAAVQAHDGGAAQGALAARQRAADQLHAGVADCGWCRRGEGSAARPAACRPTAAHLPLRASVATVSTRRADLLRPGRPAAGIAILLCCSCIGCVPPEAARAAAASGPAERCSRCAPHAPPLKDPGTDYDNPGAGRQVLERSPRLNADERGASDAAGGRAGGADPGVLLRSRGSGAGAPGGGPLAQAWRALQGARPVPHPTDHLFCSWG